MFATLVINFEVYMPLFVSAGIDGIHVAGGNGKNFRTTTNCTSEAMLSTKSPFKFSEARLQLHEWLSCCIPAGALFQEAFPATRKPDLDMDAWADLDGWLAIQEQSRLLHHVLP